MINLIENIKLLLEKPISETILKNKKLITNVKCYTSLCATKIIEFTDAFNILFDNEVGDNKLNAYIIENDDIFEKSLSELSNTSLIQTKGLKEFNKATITTSLSKCTKDENYYIMKCYDYFIYIFDKKNMNCYMIIKNNRKAITMINILLLTPYLMYGELYAIHGGLVNKGTNNIIINNSSLGGKTTFAILFATHNWNIVTEETTYITKKGIIFPFNIRNYFNIRVGTYLAFKDFFLQNNIISNDFLAMENKDNNELYDYGKTSQFSIDFDTIGTTIKQKNLSITHSLKVAIKKEQTFVISECSPLENVKSFLELSLSPTVLLFKELLKYDDINTIKREKELEVIFKNTKSFKLISGFDYKDNYNHILTKMNLEKD